MNIVVCAKQIPDPAAPQSFDASNNLDRSGKLILDEADTYGVEMALQLVDAAGGGEVTVVSMGSAADVSGLRNALAMGAAKAVIVSDDALRGTDALGTAKVLAEVIKRQNADLVLAATESSDGYTGTTPVQVAELLGLPSITFAKSVKIDGSSVKVERQTESGYDEVSAPLPAVTAKSAGTRGLARNWFTARDGCSGSRLRPPVATSRPSSQVRRTRKFFQLSTSMKSAGSPSRSRPTDSP